MALKLIKFGELNRKHFLPFILALINILMEMIIRYYPDNKTPEGKKVSNYVLELYSYSLGNLGSIFIPCIFKFDNEEISREDSIQKRKFLHFFVFIFIFIVHFVGKGVPLVLKGALTQESMNSQNSFSEGPFVYIGVEMICFLIITRFLLKYKYFKHHFLSIIAFVILGNVCDLILEYYPQMLEEKPLVIIFEFINIIIDVIFYTSEKYLMEILYYPYWKLNITIGSILFVVSSCLLIFALSAKGSSMKFVADFYLYFEKINPGIIIGKIILSIIIRFFFATFSILSVYYFNPNFFLINYQISKYVLILIDENHKVEKYYCIIIFVLQFFCLLVYLEIIELNFCGLNKNIKANINKRGVDELLGKDGRDSTLGITGNIDINEEYCIDSLENVENNNKIVEMTPKTDNEGTI